MSASARAGSSSSQVALDDLRGIVGAEHAREAGADDAVDGVSARFVAEPGSLAEASELMKLASRAGLAVAPRGGGTKLGWGNRPARLDLILSTTRMNRVLEHAAGDLVARVEAGTPLVRLQQELSKAGQQLALDPPLRGATIGGIIATNVAGPLRLRYGTMRDLLIGVTYVLPDGTVAKAGGRVVKNVAGYDLDKLFTGSLGTLALLAEAIVRLHPLPAARRVVVTRLAGAEKLQAAVQSVLGSQLVPSAMEFGWHPGGVGAGYPQERVGEVPPGVHLLATLIEGIEPGVAAQAETAAELLGAQGEAHILEEQEGQTLWKDLTAIPWEDASSIGIKINHVPSRLAEVLNAVLEQAQKHGGEARIGGHAGSGVTLVGLTGVVEESTIQIVGEIRDRVAPEGGSVVVLQAPGGLKERLEVWGPVGNALPLMQRVKARFDPAGILNPGRFVGGI